MYAFHKGRVGVALVFDGQSCATNDATAVGSSVAADGKTVDADTGGHHEEGTGKLGGEIAAARKGMAGPLEGGDKI